LIGHKRYVWFTICSQAYDSEHLVNLQGVSKKMSSQRRLGIQRNKVFEVCIVIVVLSDNDRLWRWILTIP